MKILLHLLLISDLSILTVSGDCTLGRTDLVEASSNPNPGLYIDISTPASCSGFITRWNVCHYNPRSHTTESSLLIQLQVWRFDQALRTGNLVGSNVATIDVPAQPQNFRCIPVEISDQFVNVSAGDFLGVRLPRDALPVITNFRGVGSAPTLVHTPTNVIVPTTITRRAQGVVDLSINAIFVTAEIEATPPATRGTPPDENTVLVDETPTEEGHTTTRETVSTTSGDIVVTAQLGGGPIAAIVIIALMLLAMLIAGVSIVLILLLRRRSLPMQDVFEMTRNQVYGVELEGKMKITQNEAYGRFGENIEMTPNQVYGLRPENQDADEDNEQEEYHMYEHIIDTHQEKESS